MSQKPKIEWSKHRKVTGSFEQAMEAGMTPIQREVFIFVDEWWKKYGFSPSLRDVAYLRGKSLTSTSRVVKRLIKLGVLKKVSGMGRTIRPTYINFRTLE